MGYLSCRAESSVSTCRSIAAVSPCQTNNKKKRDQGEDAAAGDREKQQHGGGDDDGDNNSSNIFRRHIEQFTYAELESATGNFSDSSLLGRGSHGSVYRATLPRPQHHHHRPSVVAVKRPSPRPALSPSPSRNEVENEIEILSKIHSPRLVNLIGFTHLSSSSSPKSKNQQLQQRLLVVEFMPNGTLYDFLHTNPRPPSWPRRLRLALQTAKALLTLHSARPPLIHRDVKSANILIDRNFNARLGDFGLALRLDDLNTDAAFPSSCRSTPPAGTLGYLDPCYVTPDNLSTKTDVFSFGILLLEIISGRKAIDVAHSPPSVVEWAVPLLRKGKVGAIFDPKISPPKDSRVRRQLAVLAASCVKSSGERRPAMEEVVEQLKALSKAVNAAARAWNGLSVVNPCSVVETKGTLSKASSNGVESNAKLGKETGRLEEEGEEVPTGIKKPPLPVPVNTSVKATRPLRNGNKVFLDEEAKRGGRNLMELLAQPDGEIIELCDGRSSVMSRAKTLRVTTDYYGRVGGGMVRLQRNQTVKGLQFESLVMPDGLQISDKRIHAQARHVT